MRRSGSHATLAVVVSAGAAVVSVVELALTSGKSPMLVVTAGRSPSAAEPLSRRAGAQRKVKEQRPEQQSVSMKQDSSSFPHGVCGPLAVVEVRVVVVISVVELALTFGWLGIGVPARNCLGGSAAEALRAKLVISTAPGAAIRTCQAGIVVRKSEPGGRVASRQDVRERTGAASAREA